MAQVTLTIPDAQVVRVRAAVAHRLGVEDPDDVGISHVQELLISQLKKIVLGFERDQATASAQAALVDLDVT